MVPASRWRSVVLTCAWALLVAAVYYLTARVGLRSALVRGQVTPLWPATGVSLAALFWLGPRALLGVVVGAFFVNVTIGPSLPAVLAITAGNALAPALSYLLLRRTGFQVSMGRFKDALGLVFLGALGGMLISASIGPVTLVLAGALQPHALLPAASVWWTGDAMGVLTVTPVLLVARTYPWRTRIRPARWVEAAALVAATTAVTFLVMRSTVDLLFLVFPFLVWAAARFHLVGAAPGALIVSVLAVQAATAGVGPFTGLDLTARMITLQAFNGSVVLTTLFLAVATAERDRATRSIEQASTQLTSLLSDLADASELPDVLNRTRSPDAEP